MFSSSGAVGFNDFRPRRLPQLGLEWTQNRTSVTLNIRVPAWVCKRHVHVEYSDTSIDVKVCNDDDTVVDIQRDLFAAIDPDSCIWALEEDDHGCSLLLELEKGNMTFWSRLFVSDDPSSYVVIDPNATATDPDSSTAIAANPSNILDGIVSSVVDEICHQASMQQALSNSASDEIKSNKDGDDQPSTVIEDASDDSNGDSIKPTDKQDNSHVDSDDLIEIKGIPKPDSLVNGSSAPSSATSTAKEKPASASVSSTVQTSPKSPTTTTNPNGDLGGQSTNTAVSRPMPNRFLSASADGKRLTLSNIGLSMLIKQSLREQKNLASNMPLIVPPEQLQALIRQHEETISHGMTGASSSLLSSATNAAAAKEEYGRAAVQLGVFYHYGIGVLTNAHLAEKLYKIALDDVGLKDANAAFQLGLLYNLGVKNEVEVDYALAVKYWSIASNLGSPTGMFNLAVMLLNGNGCDADPVTAFALFHRANQLDPNLKPPQLTEAQFRQCIKLADEQRRQRERRNVPQHVKDQRREEAMRVIKRTAYSSLGLLGLGLSIYGLRYWMRNRL